MKTVFNFNKQINKNLLQNIKHSLRHGYKNKIMCIDDVFFYIDDIFFYKVKNKLDFHLNFSILNRWEIKKSLTRKFNLKDQDDV